MRPTARRTSAAVLVGVLAGLLVGCSAAPAVTPAATQMPSPAPTPTDTPASTPTAELTSGPTSEPISTPTASAPASASAAEERVFTFDDGALTIIAPAGALSAEVNLVATQMSAADRPAELSDVPMSGTFYRLEPDGLSFPEPLTIIRRVSLAEAGIDPGGPLPIVSLALRTTDGNWNWLANQTEISDGEYLYISGEASHTSQMLGFGGVDRFSVGWDAVQLDKNADLKVSLGSSFTLNSTVDAPLDAPAPPVINELDPNAAASALIGRYGDFYPNFSEPFTHTGVLAQVPQIKNPTGWDSQPNDWRASNLPTFSQGFTCTKVGHFYTVVGYEVVDAGAGNALWNRLDLPAPSTAVFTPLRGNCLEQAAPPAVEVGAACVITVHTARGTFVSYMRGLIKLITDLGGPEISGIEITLDGANNNEPVSAQQVVNNGWQFIAGLHSAGKKKIKKVEITFADGQTQDVTALVTALLGGATLDVPFPAEPTFGTCPTGSEKWPQTQP